MASTLTGKLMKMQARMEKVKKEAEGLEKAKKKLESNTKLND